MPIEHHLQVNDSGRLFLPFTDENRGTCETVRDEDQLILLHIYPEGDCDYCNWPFKVEDDERRLAATLFDEGNLCRLQPGIVFLPNGEVFGEIVLCGFNLYHCIHPAKVYRHEDEEAKEIPNPCYEQAKQSRSIGDEICIHVSAPGTGHILYSITHIDEHGIYGVIVENTVRELTADEVV